MPILYNSKNSMLPRLTYRDVITQLNHPSITPGIVLLLLTVMNSDEKPTLDSEVDCLDLGLIITNILMGDVSQ